MSPPVADVLPLLAVHYDLDKVGSLAEVLAPPYDVIDDAQRAELAARSPYNAVELDLPRKPGGGDPYEYAAELLAKWIEDGALVRDDDPQIWALEPRRCTADSPRIPGPRQVGPLR